MDNISSIIQLEDTPYQETSQFCSHPLGLQQQHVIPQDYHLYYHQLFSKPLQDHGMNNIDHDLCMVGEKSVGIRFQRSKSSSCIEFRSSKDEKNSSADHNQSCKRKNIVHRDIERQRRQDMASFHGSLRSLLPLEYLKGKRSISDHIHEASNYIKQMEEKIRKMTDKRNKLKRLANSDLNSSMETVEGSATDSLKIEIEPCCVGVEVAITTGMKQQGFPLSRVLAVLTQEGLTIVSCISTKVNQRMLYSIKCEVKEGSNIDLSGMQQKLNNSIKKGLQIN